LQPLMQKQPPIARPPGNFGTSGSHHVPDVSPSINPEILGAVPPRDKVRQLAVTALTIANRQAEAACHGSRQIHSDAALPAPDRHRRADSFATTALMPCLDPIEKARRTYEKELAGLREKLARPAEISEIKQTEIRSKLAGLPAIDRVRAIIRSIEKGNDDVASSVLNGDRLLTDFLTDTEESVIRDTWGRVRFPDEAARVKVLESDLSHLERTSRILVSYQRECAGPSIVAPPATTAAPILFSPYGSAGLGAIEGAARRARGLA
jgi:hypothetical protein